MRKRKDRKYTWRLKINSVVIHRFFNRILGFPTGRKSRKITNFIEKRIPNFYFKCFLSGLIDSDGYISQRYIGLIQNNKRFLLNVRKTSKEILNINFKKPYVNRKIDNKIVGWIITIHKKEDIQKFQKIIPLRYKGPVAQFG